MGVFDVLSFLTKASDCTEALSRYRHMIDLHMKRFSFALWVLFVRNEAGIYLDIANAYMYGLVALLNPLIHTLWTKGFTDTFKCKRSKKEYEPGLIESHDVASIPSQQTRILQMEDNTAQQTSQLI